MFKFLAVVALFAAVASAGTLPRRLDGKIVGGEETTIEEIPHQISFQYFGGHNCGGSIIGKHWVLSAAHCVHSKEYHLIHAGGNETQKPGSVHKIREFFVHPDYGHNWNSPARNDIALIQVEEPFEFDATRQPVPIFNQDEESPEGAIAVISGWGNTGSGSPRILNVVEVPIISKAKCAKRYESLGVFEEGQICAAYDEGGKDSCQGDSGGPLTINGRLAGIVSWGIGCALPGKPGVYTEVAYFHDWIVKTILNAS